MSDVVAAFEGSSFEIVKCFVLLFPIELLLLLPVNWMTTESKILRLVNVYGAFKATARRSQPTFFRLKIRQ